MKLFPHGGEHRKKKGNERKQPQVCQGRCRMDIMETFSTENVKHWSRGGAAIPKNTDVAPGLDSLLD